MTMISVKVTSEGYLEVEAEPASQASEWLRSLTSDRFFTTEESELAISTPPSESEEINEDWEQYALPEVISSANLWRERFVGGPGLLRFKASEKTEFAGFLNRARLKIAMEGTGDILPPSKGSLRSPQYEFLTAFVEWVLSLPEGTEATC